jgi:hypothetical protein
LNKKLIFLLNNFTSSHPYIAACNFEASLAKEDDIVQRPKQNILKRLL